MLSSRGLQVSAFGFVLVVLSAVSLFVLPRLLGIVGMSVGALCVGGGFIWTLLEYYLPDS